MRIAVVGDVHEQWDRRDSELLDAQGYDAVLFVGDIAGYTVHGGLATARRIATLRTPAWLIPGNHDAVHVGQLAAEVFDRLTFLRGKLDDGMARRVEALREALGPVALVGYELVQLGEVSLLAARPHSAGGPRLTYPRYMREAFGVEDMEASAQRLRSLVDEAAGPLVVLAHNGPAGLGAARSSICGRDFHPEAGDWGDPDLRAALDHARDTGKAVRAVVFGHMHRSLRGGGVRAWRLRDEGCLHVNAAEVPRHRPQGRHHVLLEVGETTSATDVWL